MSLLKKDSKQRFVVFFNFNFKVFKNLNNLHSVALYLSSKVCLLFHATALQNLLNLTRAGNYRS